MCQKLECGKQCGERNVVLFVLDGEYKVGFIFIEHSRYEVNSSFIKNVFHFVYAGHIIAGGCETFYKVAPVFIINGSYGKK
jgi:hypothetical protein